MPILPDAALAYVGVQTELMDAPERVEPGAVRRYAQAIMDDDPAWWDPAAAPDGVALAPPLFPTHMFRRPPGTPDPLRERADSPDFDGSGATTLALPEIAPLRGWSVLNGGADIELLRLVRHGERVRMRARYASITEKPTSKGPIVLVVVTNDYVGEEGDVIARLSRTYIRKPA